MIGYLEGRLLKKEADRILLLVNHVGYEVLVPNFVMETLKGKNLGEELSLYIYYHQTERQPKPILVGFNIEAEKEFFEYIISVEDIGPLKAVKALTMSVRDIARAIEMSDSGRLTKLKGVGVRTAEKIIVSLRGKVGKFALMRNEDKKAAQPLEDFTKQVYEVLIHQLGYSAQESKDMITKALKRNSLLATPEELFEEIYRGEKT
ncbi:MAG: Holliday junction branch migration protein RuvA [Desulfobacterales bacterium]|nr:Holliday junction branch migration protein RuvA [Desulfobacterales bacterium]MBF0397740.1 Holliday junction branch migration protein RuvA [Desulfobacterales bacterium]